MPNSVFVDCGFVCIAVVVIVLLWLLLSLLFAFQLQVAIKCLGQERMTSNSTEFLKEAAVMHSIEHPNIVRLYGVVLHMDSLMLV